MSSVYIIEDQTILRELVCRLVRDMDGFELAGQAGDGLDGLEACKELKPDMAIVDIMVPSLNGLEIVRMLKKAIPKTKLIVFSGNSTRERVQAALKAGVDGIVQKDSSIDDLETAIRRVMQGSSYMSSDILDIMRDLMINPSAGSDLDKLTAREREILQLVAEGHTTKEVAARLGVSAKTADSHRTNVMAKLDLHDVASLTRFAIANGLVEV
jgi:DNA-binding NarL/FixJ family response regulator